MLAKNRAVELAKDLTAREFTKTLAKDHIEAYIRTLTGRPDKSHTEEDIGGGYSYPLVEPRPEEVLDINNSTEVLSTGAERSQATIHVKKTNPIYFQHMTDGEKQGEEHGKDRNAKKIT